MQAVHRRSKISKAALPRTHHWNSIQRTGLLFSFNVYCCNIIRHDSAGHNI